MNVAYGVESFPSQGPVVNLGEIVSLLTAQNLKSYKILQNDGPFSHSPKQLANGDYKLTYDQPFTYDNSELSGFFFCCGEPGFCRSLLQLKVKKVLKNVNAGENFTTKFLSFTPQELFEKCRLASCGEGIGAI